MKKNKLIFLILIIVYSYACSQSLLYEIPVEDQINNSSLVIEGRVIKKKSYRSSINNNIYTVNTIQIYKVFKGVEQEYINFVTKGGTIGFEREVIKPSLQLKVNDVGFFILNEFEALPEVKEIGYDLFYAEADLQGFYKYNEVTNTVNNPYDTFESIDPVFYNFIENMIPKSIQILNYDFSANNSLSSKSLENPIISSFSPEEIRAGIGDLLTISGSDFGDEIGAVYFKNADNGGSSFEEIYVSDVILWENNTIVVQVPSFAGTGEVMVETALGDSVNSAEEIRILSSELNVEFDSFFEESFRAKLIDSDNNGGYTWTCNEDFKNNTEALDVFRRAIDTWVCTTGISWLISEDSSAITGAASDEINLVTFKSGSENNFDEISNGVLAVTTTYYSGCVSNTGEVTSVVSEIDMTFNEDSSWFYGEEKEDIGFFQNDFQGTATHELGHAHGLGHVIAPTNLMHFETSSGEDSATREIDEDSRIGAELNYLFSENTDLCGEEEVVSRDCMDYSQTIITTVDQEETVVINNPVDEELIIYVREFTDVEANLNYELYIYDLSGRNIRGDIVSDFVEPIDVSTLSSGVYILKLIVGTEIFIKIFNKISKGGLELIPNRLFDIRLI